MHTLAPSKHARATIRLSEHLWTIHSSKPFACPALQKTRLQELGPRFTLKLKWLQVTLTRFLSRTHAVLTQQAKANVSLCDCRLIYFQIPSEPHRLIYTSASTHLIHRRVHQAGTFDTKTGEYEWVRRRNKIRTKFALWMTLRLTLNTLTELFSFWTATVVVYI